MRHLGAIILDQRVLKKWSPDQLPLVMRILNSKEKNYTGVISSRVVKYTENLLTKQKVLLELAQERQRKHDALSKKD